MDGLWAPIITVAVFALTVGSFPWIAYRVRTRGIGGGILSPFQDIWDPTVHREQADFQVQLEREAPAPAPGDPPA